MSKNEQAQVEIRQADIVIVGCGAGGMAAAIEAKDNGAERIIVLEKLHAPGGNCIFPPLPLANEDGVLKMACMDDNTLLDDDLRLNPDITVRTDANFKSAMEWNHWRGDARLIRTLINKFEGVSDWLKSNMEPADFLPDPEVNRGKLAKLLIRFCKARGIEVLCDTPVKNLLKDKNGRVNGVLAETKDGNKIQVNAKSVIISTGGFIGSKELMAKYFHSYTESVFDDLCIMGLRHTGDGIKMALDAGAASDGTVAFEWELNRVPWLNNPVSPLTNLLNNDIHPDLIWVNKNGERFADESKLNATNSWYRLPHKTCYILLDEAMKNRIIKNGPVKMPDFMIGLDLFAGLDDELKDQEAKGRVKISDSWDELAEFIGADPEVLKATVDEYNSFCDKKHDDMFVKNPEYLTPLRTGPFYVAKSTLAMLVTRGPLKVNTKMELLDTNDDPIPGLYAAGVDIGGTDSDTYASGVACHSIGWSLSSGRIAGENAAKAAK
ncbi:MAG: Succinate dehydrogenase/fumarate reductase, flavoprotein subunit [Firmicutes bacterium]|nr:Succinate dehydrogenase/fumarate reductase, flavoprotein subunit [Bacillota bacterium]